MKAVAVVSSLASLAAAAAVSLSQQDSLLNVKIERVGNSEVKASISNNGNEVLRILKTGSILDSAPVEKVKVTQGCMCLYFLVDFSSTKLTIKQRVRFPS